MNIAAASVWNFRAMIHLHFLINYLEITFALSYELTGVLAASLGLSLMNEIGLLEKGELNFLLLLCQTSWLKATWAIKGCHLMLAGHSPSLKEAKVGKLKPQSWRQNILLLHTAMPGAKELLHKYSKKHGNCCLLADSLCGSCIASFIMHPKTICLRNDATYCGLGAHIN